MHNPKIDSLVVITKKMNRIYKSLLLKKNKIIIFNKYNITISIVSNILSIWKYFFSNNIIKIIINPKI